MTRGDIVAAALPGDNGKPRPALVIQGDLFGAFPLVAILPLTSTRLDGVLTRIDVEPNERNGLRVASQIICHRVTTIRRDKIGPIIGRLDDTTLVSVNRALIVFLGLA